MVPEPPVGDGAIELAKSGLNDTDQTQPKRGFISTPALAVATCSAGGWTAFTAIRIASSLEMPPAGVGGGVYAGAGVEPGRPVAVGVVPGDSDVASGAPTHEPPVLV